MAFTPFKTDFLKTDYDTSKKRLLTTITQRNMQAFGTERLDKREMHFTSRNVVLGMEIQKCLSENIHERNTRDTIGHLTLGMAVCNSQNTAQANDFEATIAHLETSRWLFSDSMERNSRDTLNHLTLGMAVCLNENSQERNARDTLNHLKLGMETCY